MIHSINLKIKVFSPNMHHCQSLSFQSTSWWSGVIDSTFTYNGCKTVLHMQHTWVKLDEPSMYRHGLETMNYSNGAYSGRILLSWNLVKGSSYNDIVVLSKIRCIKDKHHMQSKICDMIWPSSSCAFDLHLQSIVMISIVTSSTPWSPSLHRCVEVVTPTFSSTTIANA